MAAGSYRSFTYRARSSPGRRVASAALALGIVTLIILALLRMGGFIPKRFGDGRALTTFDVTEQGSTERQATRRTTQRETKRAAREEQRPEPPRRAPPPPVPPPLPVFSDALPGVIYMGRADFRAADVGRIKGTAGPATGTQVAEGGDSDPAIGTGPNGEPLYAAEWYRRPRRAETQPYMPAGKTGWGVVACRTAPRFRVEDCQELGETPGSGIARGLRQAAWQFLVRPPRKGGQDMIGVWVRIRFDILPTKTDDDAP